MRRLSLLSLLFLATVALAGAGDLSTFVNLGFSSDSRFFAFGTYGMRDDRIPLAELYVVDVAKNAFVKDGSASSSGKTPVGLGKDGLNSLLKLVLGKNNLFASNRIDPELTGRLIYILLNGDEKPNAISFRDFQTGHGYTIDLIQSSSDKGASFYMNVAIDKGNGTPVKYKIGNQSLVRAGVAGYKIRQVTLSPNEKSLVAVIEKIHPADSPIASSFMVETLAF